jgi:hypothetical protein
MTTWKLHAKLEFASCKEFAMRRLLVVSGAALLAGGTALGAAAQSQPASPNPGQPPNGTSNNETMGNGQMGGMMGMMPQMNRMMNNCNQMMESHMRRHQGDKERT